MFNSEEDMNQVSYWEILVRGFLAIFLIPMMSLLLSTFLPPKIVAILMILSTIPLMLYLWKTMAAWGCTVACLGLFLAVSTVKFHFETERLSTAIRLDNVTVEAARASREAEVFFFSSPPEIHKRHAIQHSYLSDKKWKTFNLAPVTDEDWTLGDPVRVWVVCNSQEELNKLQANVKAASRLSPARMENRELQAALLTAREWSFPSTPELVLEWGDPYLANQHQAQELKKSFGKFSAFWFLLWILMLPNKKRQTKFL